MRANKYSFCCFKIPLAGREWRSLLPPSSLVNRCFGELTNNFAVKAWRREKARENNGKLSLLWPYHARGSLPCRYGSFLPKWHRSKLWSAQFHPPLNLGEITGGSAVSGSSAFDKMSLSLSLPPSPMAHGCCMYYRRCRATPCAALLGSLPRIC